jgi:quercetin dioxygenase-like cupin family protein
MARLSLLVAAILLILSGLVIAQDGGTASQVYKVVLDNERVRVQQASFKPGDKVGMRSYPSHLMVPLTDGTLIFVPDGRTGYEVNLKTGEALWFQQPRRAIENDSDKEVRVLLVELKDGGGARAGRAAKVKSKAKAKSKAAPKAAPKAKGKK